MKGTGLRRIIHVSLIAGFFLFYNPVVRAEKAVVAVDISQEEALRQLRRDLKKELLAELSGRVHEMVRKEVALELDRQLAALKPHDPAATLADADRISRATSEGDLRMTVREVVQEVVQEHLARLENMVSDKELDSVAAGRGVTELSPDGDFYMRTRPSEFQLARAKNADTPASTMKAGALTSHDLNLAAGQMAESDSIERTLVQKGSVLLAKGAIQVEPSLTWAHFSSNRININGLVIEEVVTIGDVKAENVKRDIIFSNLALKYGLWDNLQAELKIPFRTHYERVNDTNQGETTKNTSGLGDIEFGLSRQIGWEEGWKPALIASIGLKSDTGKSPFDHDIGLGTGYWSIRNSIIAAKSSDPVVIFGALNYIWNISENINGVDVNPGDTVSYSLGTAIALSYQTSINFSFDHSLTMKQKNGGEYQDGTFLNSANLKMGFNWARSNNSSIDFSVGFGLTNDAPDLTVDIRFPYTF